MDDKKEELFDEMTELFKKLNELTAIGIVHIKEQLKKKAEEDAKENNQ